MSSNELTLLARLARWLESQGGVVTSTSFKYAGDQATVTAVLDLEKTDLKPPPGVKELKQLTMQARAAVDVALPKSPTMLELLAHNMGGHILQLEAIGRRRGENYYFDLQRLIEKEKNDAG